MGLYADLADCADPVVTVEESDLLAADAIITPLLRNRGIGAAETIGAEGLALLKELAVCYATATAATRGAHDGPDSVMWEKRKAYNERAHELAQRVYPEALGIVRESGGYGSITLGRG